MKKIGTHIVVDAMGGDFAVDIPVKAAAMVSKNQKFHIQLVGNSEKIKKVLSKEKYNPDHLSVLHTYEYIGDNEFPRNIIRQKKKASMNIATELCGKKKAQAVVSAGNTGAYILSSLKNIPRIDHINKVAIVSLFPTKKFLTGNKKHYSLILDIGANNQCSAEDLYQFAIMGNIYFKLLTGKVQPKVFLLNIGDEAHKGGKELVKAHKLLSTNEILKFCGNIEGNKIFNGEADVIVSNGFAGNVVLKTTEGMVESLLELGKIAADTNLLWKAGLFLLNSGIQKIRPLLDYSEYGGAPILGFREVVVKAHGRSNVKAFYNAILLAAQLYQKQLAQKIYNELK